MIDELSVRPVVAREDVEVAVEVGQRRRVGSVRRRAKIRRDEEIVVVGGFTGLGGGTGTTTRNRIGRLNPDGTLDTTFNPGANGTSEWPPRWQGVLPAARFLIHAIAPRTALWV